MEYCSVSLQADGYEKENEYGKSSDSRVGWIHYWSPDSKEIAVALERGDIMDFPVKRSNARMICKWNEDHINQITGWEANIAEFINKK